MSRTTQGTVTTGLTLIAVFVVSMVSIFVVYPMAAWNQNLVLMVIAGLAPMVMTRIALATKGIAAVPTKTPGSSLHALAVMAVAGLLLWHHMMFLLILLIIVLLVMGSKKRKRR